MNRVDVEARISSLSKELSMATKLSSIPDEIAFREMDEWIQPHCYQLAMLAMHLVFDFLNSPQLGLLNCSSCLLQCVQSKLPMLLGSLHRREPNFVQAQAIESKNKCDQ
jgi:hypothetical protein